MLGLCMWALVAHVGVYKCRSGRRPTYV